MSAPRSIVALAESFHVLVGAPGVNPWNPIALDKWARSGASAAEADCARFVLKVWNTQHKWLCGQFDVVRAIQRWDCSNLAAFQAWAMDPWTA